MRDILLQVKRAASASACGKLILFGEHAVVYGRPALAVPLSGLRARVDVRRARGRGVVIRAPDIGRLVELDKADSSDPLAAVVGFAFQKLGALDGLEVEIHSDIPVAAGFGSGAAISTAILRALADFSGRPLAPEEISELVFEVEKLYHGTPSGVDNTVIAFERPVRYVRDREITPFAVARPFSLVVADTGVPSLTRLAVGDVRRGWEQEPARYEAIFDAIGDIVERAELALARGEDEQLGPLMDRNQAELEKLGVSSQAIEQLLRAGRKAGAQGGKLSGGGRGGNVILAVAEDHIDRVSRALTSTGATRVFATTVGA
jgi:mevalonate kinase